jgi:hypothetical protein
VWPARVWNKVFNRLHSSTTTLLTSLFIHVVDITPRDVLLIHNLTKFLKMFINGSPIETLGLLWIKTRWLAQSEMRTLFEESPIPF